MAEKTLASKHISDGSIRSPVKKEPNCRLSFSFKANHAGSFLQLSKRRTQGASHIFIPEGHQVYAAICAPVDPITHRSMYLSSSIFIDEVCTQKPLLPSSPPKPVSPPLSTLSPAAMEFIHSHHPSPTSTKEVNISFRGFSISDTKRENPWSNSKAYDSDFEHLGNVHKQENLEEVSEWETDYGLDEEEDEEDWHSKKKSRRRRNLAKFDNLSKQLHGGSQSKPRRSNRLATLRNEIIYGNMS